MEVAIFWRSHITNNDNNNNDNNENLLCASVHQKDAHGAATQTMQINIRNYSVQKK